ncbi:MAG: 30S ribosomal protein S12 methylthiotransferase RimO [Lentisphaerae bacterium]|nr:30S ribosomal protein S12 methylthiotransferase RimO [Lentisphaerota bacterium]
MKQDPPSAPVVSVGFISLGCAKNLVDSEVMATRLLNAGFTLAPSPDEADIVIVNTCAFIRDARQESDGAIRQVCAWKAAGPGRHIVVAGCMPQRYRRALRESYPAVDAFIGLDDVERIPDILRRLLREQTALFDIAAESTAVIDPPPARVRFTGKSYAYIKVAEGCDSRCSYCAIPLIRGRYRSRRLLEILKEAEDLLAHGALELNLISQDILSYGRDLSPATGLPALLEALGRLGGRFWIRLLYAHPDRMTPAILDAMAAVKQVCRYLDIPIQHCDAGILRTMNRKGSPDAYRALIRSLREGLPGIALRTTCLLGFPGETDRHFQTLLDFIEEIRFEHLSAFVFSPEENTPAASLPDPVPAALAEERRARLMAVQRKIVDRNNRARVGQTAEILVEAPDARRKGGWIGRSEREAPEVDGVVRLKARALQPARFVKARFTAHRDYDMCADVL